MFLKPPPFDESNIADRYVTPLDIQAPPGAMRLLVDGIFKEYDAYYATQFKECVEAEVATRLEAEIAARVEAEVAERIETEVARRVQALYEQLILSRRRMFGRKSEIRAGKGRLFDEADSLAAVTTAVDDQVALPVDTAVISELVKPSALSARGKRHPLAAELTRIDVVHDVPEAARVCSCGSPMVEIGEDISEQLDIVPLQIRVLRHIRKRYGCRGGHQAPVTAAAPAQVLPKSNASNDLLAMVLTAKYVDGLPLARIEQVISRAGAPVPRHTLARWVINTAQALMPIHNLLRDALLESPVIHMDETVVQVLKENDKQATSNSYMWVQKGVSPDHPVILYDYDPSRSGQVPERLLAGWQGYLMTDGYEGYNAVARTPGIEHLVCWAHVRRAFVEATKVQAKGKPGRADQALALIGQLYRLEREVKDASDADRLAVRQSRSLPVLGELRAWLDKTRPTIVPGLALGRALAYLDKYWDKLVRYTERGDLPIDNNPCENAIRPFVLGRKAWLFADTPAGAHASALIYSLIESAKANQLEPYTWLRRVLRLLPTARTLEDYEALLPWNMHPNDLIIETSD